jgi:hypothetical protein
LPPAQLGFIAAASASPKIPITDGGEFTQPQKRGCPLPKGNGAIVSRNSRRMPSGDSPAAGTGVE